MNLFKKYGIKEVADVTFYSIIKIGDEEFYIPVLTLDTLKISTVEQKVQDVVNNGGYGNSKVMAWSFDKDINLTLNDALCSAASLSMSYGWLNSKLSIYTSLIRKINIAWKYYKLNYSIYARPSPKLTEEESEALFLMLSDLDFNYTLYPTFKSLRDVWLNFNENGKNAPYLTKEFLNEPYVAEGRKAFFEHYYQRKSDGSNPNAEYRGLIMLAFGYIQNINDYYKIDTDNYELEVIDRMESCLVTNEEGLKVDFKQQWENLKDYFNNDKTHSYTIFYDSKTMQPLVANYTGEIDKKNIHTLKKGTLYFKWTRTVQQKIDDRDLLGKTLVINTNIFPDEFRIVGETYIREQRTHKDSRYQFIIPRAKISNNTNITLQADGDPTTFQMGITVLNPDNGNMMELRQFDVIEDEEFGGTKILPQRTEYTKTQIEYPEPLNEEVDNKVYI